MTNKKRVVWVVERKDGDIWTPTILEYNREHARFFARHERKEYGGAYRVVKYVPA